MKNKGALILIIVVVVIILLLVVFRTQITNLFNPKITGTTTNPPAKQTSTITTSGQVQTGTPLAVSSSSLNMNLVLMMGSTGPEVTQLQNWLGVSADGIFGQDTYNTLYQATGQTMVSLNHFQQLMQQYAAAQGGVQPSNDSNSPFLQDIQAGINWFISA